MKWIKEKKYILLALIILLSAFFRLHNISNNPPSLTWDEVAWGYNAYTLGIEGKDEFGRFLPRAYLESFGDYKPPVYAYLDIIPVKIFGLKALAVRLPSAILGTLTVGLVYFLTRRIFPKSENAVYYALGAALVMALSPWHIMLSRAAFEANVATFFIILGMWLYLKSIQEKSWLFLAAVISLVISFYTFNTARIVSPLLIGVLSVVFYKDLLRMKKKVIVSGILGLVLLTPAIQFLTTPQAKIRFNEVNIFTNIEVIEASNKQIENDNNQLYSRILHNRRLMFAVEYLDHYFDHFNPQYLFISGDENPKFTTRQTGQLYLWDLPFLVLGVILLFKRKEGHYWIIPVWLLIAIVPAGTARETPHALRTEAVLPMFAILIAYGLVHAVCFVRKKVSPKISKLLILATALGLTLSVLYFYNYYSNHYAREFSGAWQYGYEQTFEYLKDVEDEYDSIYMNDVLGRPYIYYLFERQKDPSVLRNNAEVDRGVFGLVDVRRVENYHFVRDIHALPTEGKSILYVNVPNAVPESAQIKKEITTLDGEKQLIIYTNEGTTQ